jgi:hypothetical protein
MLVDPPPPMVTSHQEIYVDVHLVGLFLELFFQFESQVSVVTPISDVNTSATSG